MESTSIKKETVNIFNLAHELSALTGRSISAENIHANPQGRYYYTQAPKQGAPMLLHHYRGPFFVDMHPDDYEAIATGKIEPHEYIITATWMVGYYWGGGSMVSGGYYQPLDIVNRKEEVRRYLQILECRGHRISCGYMPTKEKCDSCDVENCPFSEYKRGTKNWDAEIQEPDPRREFFKALAERFSAENPGEYGLKGFLCGSIPNGEIWLSPNGRYTEDQGFTFTAYAPSYLIRSLLMHEIEPDNWEMYAKNFSFRVRKMFDSEVLEATEENLKKVYEGMDYTIKKDTTPSNDLCEEKIPLKTRITEFFKNFF